MVVQHHNKTDYFNAVIFQQCKFYNYYLFYMGIYQKKMPNDEIIATQIGPHFEYSDNFIKQILYCIQYMYMYIWGILYGHDQR